MSEVIERRWLHPHFDEEWKLRAACRGEDPGLWFPSAIGRRHYDRTVRTLTARAKAICLRCPVQGECLQYGLDEPWGIWGGLTEEERAQF
jgi:WhiB family transcriptional regulator, redox-sensing transcriptional regulator